MKTNFTKKTATLLLSTALLGGVVVTTTPAFTTAISAQSLDTAPITYSTFKADEAAVKAAIKGASRGVQQQIDAAFFKRMEKKPVAAYGKALSPYFTQITDSLTSHAVSELGKNGSVTANFKKDYKALITIYNHFKGRLDPDNQDEVDVDIVKADKQITANKVKTGTIENIGNYFRSYFSADIRPNKVTGVPRTSTVKSAITKLQAKKTTSKKYIKVNGTAKLGRKANVALIKTYNGTRYAKLNSRHNFSKKFYAPKAKTVTVAVGYYVNGHFTRVTSTKSVHVR